MNEPTTQRMVNINYVILEINRFKESIAGSNYTGERACTLLVDLFEKKAKKKFDEPVKVIEK